MFISLITALITLCIDCLSVELPRYLPWEPQKHICSKFWAMIVHTIVTPCTKQPFLNCAWHCLPPIYLFLLSMPLKQGMYVFLNCGIPYSSHVPWDSLIFYRTGGDISHQNILTFFKYRPIPNWQRDSLYRSNTFMKLKYCFSKCPMKSASAVSARAPFTGWLNML